MLIGHGIILNGKYSLKLRQYSRFHFLGKEKSYFHFTCLYLFTFESQIKDCVKCLCEENDKRWKWFIYSRRLEHFL